MQYSCSFSAKCHKKADQKLHPTLQYKRLSKMKPFSVENCRENKAKDLSSHSAE